MNPSLTASGSLTSNIGQYLTAFSIRSVGQFFPAIWSILLIFAVILAIILLLAGSFQWITAGDDKEKMASARGRIMAAVIGLIVILLAWAIAGLLMSSFGFPSVFQISGGESEGTSGQCTDQNGKPGQTCSNLNKCDIAGGCNSACCASAADCPSDQNCSIPNGYCKSGKSCSPQTESHKECVGDQCVYVPGAGSDQCTWHSDCQ